MSRTLAELLEWAIDFVESENSVLIECHTVSGHGLDPAVVTEVQEAKDWIEDAKDALARLDREPRHGL